MAGKQGSENFSFHRVRYMYTTNRTWRKIAIATLILLLLLLIALIVALVCFFTIRPSGDIQHDDTGGTSTSTQNPLYDGCFPPEALVETRSGSKRLDELRLGDQILDLDEDGRPSWTTVTAWLYIDDHRRSLTEIRSVTRVISLTASHMIFRRKQLQYQAVPSRDIRPNDQVLVFDSSNRTSRLELVVDVRSIGGRGVYSPLTDSGTLLVDNVWVSCFGGPWLNGLIGHDFLQTYAFLPLRMLVRSINYLGLDQLQDQLFQPSIYHLWYVKGLKSLHSLFA